MPNTLARTVGFCRVADPSQHWPGLSIDCTWQETHALEERVGHVLKIGRRKSRKDLHLGPRQLLDDETVVFVRARQCVSAGVQVERERESDRRTERLHKVDLALAARRVPLEAAREALDELLVAAALPAESLELLDPEDCAARRDVAELDVCKRVWVSRRANSEKA